MGSNNKFFGQWRKEPQAVIDRFKRVQKRFKPVMRHYFTEKHKTPMSWFAMRLHYARSVATNSIVGHILGLGDRHTSNILIDNKTGEVVHIDLGIAFEQVSPCVTVDDALLTVYRANCSHNPSGCHSG